MCGRWRREASGRRARREALRGLGAGGASPGRHEQIPQAQAAAPRQHDVAEGERGVHEPGEPERRRKTGHQQHPAVQLHDVEAAPDDQGSDHERVAPDVERRGQLQVRSRTEPIKLAARLATGRRPPRG